MSLKQQLTQAMKEAMKSKDSVSLGTVRMVLSAIKNKEIDAGGELDDAAVTAVLSTLAKQRREAAQAFRDGGRSESELDALIDAAIAECGAASMKEMGLVMKLVTPKTTGRADGRMVSERVKARLSS